MNTTSRPSLRPCLAMAALCLVSAVSALAQTWIMDAKSDLSLSTRYDCSATARLVPAPDGGTYLLNNPTFAGDIRIERIRRLDAVGALDPNFNYKAPSGSTIQTITALNDGSLIVHQVESDSSTRTLHLSRTGSLLADYSALKGTYISKMITLASGRVIISGQMVKDSPWWTPVLMAINPATEEVSQIASSIVDANASVYNIQPRAKEGFWIRGDLSQPDAQGNPGRHNAWLALHDDGTLDPSFKSSLYVADGPSFEGVAPMSDGSVAIITNNPNNSFGGTKLAHLKADGTADALFDKLSLNYVSKVWHLAPNYLALEVRDQVSVNHPSIISTAHSYDNTHSTVLIVSEDGSLIRNLNDSLPADWDVRLAGLLGNGGVAVRQGLALRSIFQGWEFTTYVIDIHKPALAWTLPLGTATALTPLLLETKAGTVSQYLPDNHGGLFLSGNFSSINGQPRPGLAHLLADGSLDPNFRDLADTGYSGKIAFIDPDGSLLFLNEEVSPTADAGNVRTPRHMLRRFTNQGAYDTSFKGLESSESNRLKVLNHSSKGYLVSSFFPDDTQGSNLRLQWYDQAGTPLTTPASPSFSGVAKSPNLGETPLDGMDHYANTLAHCLSLPDGRMAIYSGTPVWPDNYFQSRLGFTGVNGLQVPSFFFINEDLVPDQAANARLNGILSADWAALNTDGTIELSTWDASLGRVEFSSLALLPDGSRDPRHPSYVPTTSNRVDKVWTFVDQTGKAVAASNFIQENNRSLWSLNPFAHYHRNTAPGLITLEPFQQSVAVGQRAGMILVADNPFTASCQWFHNGELMPGEANSYLSIPCATLSDAGEYRVEFTIAGSNDTLVRLAHLNVTPSNTGLQNISARATVSPASPLVLGLSLQATSSHKLLARAVGRGLADYGAPAPLLGDSKLSLFGSGGVLQSKSGGINDPEIASLASQVGAFNVLNGTASPGSALAPSLGTGVYSLVSESTDGSTGTALSEVYLTDASDLPTGSLRNLSARGRVDAGGNPFIVGLVVKGTTPLRILLRAVGPELSGFGISDALADPVMEFHSDYSTIPFTLNNDNWSGDAAIAAAFKQVGAFDIPANSKDSALLLTLDPGVYTVLIRDAKSAAGTVLVEAYVLN